MAAANHIYIYIGKNGTPTILNVDNAADAEFFESLGAVKMPEAMASEVFGDNARYADSTNTTVTPNPDNPEFPFTVVFDSTKIVKPKRYTGNFAKLAMPNNARYIDISFVETDSYVYNAGFTAPANGYVFVSGKVVDSPKTHIAGVHINNYDMSAHSNGTLADGCGCFLPVEKGNFMVLGAISMQNIQMRFYYAIGEL